MEMTPSVRSTRFAQLDPGDLFIGHYETGSYVALAVNDPHAFTDPNAKEKMVLLLGPTSQTFPRVPVLTQLPGRGPVVSFAKDYKLRLPCEPGAWLTIEPPDECPCLVLAPYDKANGGPVEDKLCMRALFQTGIRGIPVYIGIKDGVLVTDANHNFDRPSGDCAYTSDWAFLTLESDPREIISSHAK